MGIATAPIGLDEHGAVVAELDDLDVPAVLLTPAHHNPYGMPLHPSRRTAVVEWAQRTDGYVLDDDYDGEFRYDRQPIGALQALSPERVVYLGSASKSLSPVLRLGWMVLPTDLVDPVIDAEGGSQFYVDGIAQLTMADFITSGGYDKHIRRMRMRYRRRRDLLVQALSASDVGISGLDAGLQPDTDAARRGRTRGAATRGRGRRRHFQVCRVMRHPLGGPEVPRPDGLVVGFGTPAEHAFPGAVDALRAVLNASGLGG